MTEPLPEDVNKLPKVQAELVAAIWNLLPSKPARTEVVLGEYEEACYLSWETPLGEAMLSVWNTDETYDWWVHDFAQGVFPVSEDSNNLGQELCPEFTQRLTHIVPELKEQADREYEAIKASGPNVNWEAVEKLFRTKYVNGRLRGGS